jgi:hypothetical protein
LAAAVRGGKRALRLQFVAKACRKLHSPVFETSESCKKLQKIAIPDRETGLIKALQADAAKNIRGGRFTLTLRGHGRMKHVHIIRLV